MTLADKIRNFGNQALSAISGEYTDNSHQRATAYAASPGHPNQTQESSPPAGPVPAPPLSTANYILPNYPTAPAASPSNTLNFYTTDKVATDNYWSASRYANEAQNRPGTFTSLTGEDVVASELEHNNMQPFFGSNVTQSVPDMAVESRLDNMAGAGSQYIEKRGSAPLFEPAPNHGTPYGMQCHTDFLQCRQVPSQRIANAKPFEEERVAPGLGLGGETNAGIGGYNAGVSAREAWLPKTVDELRAPNKPKVSYQAQVLGGKFVTDKRGEIGAFNQKGPDKTMDLGVGLMPAGGSTWAEAPGARGEYAEPHSDRGTGAELPTGPAGTNVPSNDRRDAQANPVHRIGAVDSAGRVAGPAQMYGAPGAVSKYEDEALPTGRGNSLGSSFYGAAKTLAREVILPVLGTFKLLNKEIASGNPTPIMAPTGPEGTYRRYLDKARPTLKETTLKDEVGPASSYALGWGIASAPSDPRKEGAKKLPIMAPGGPNAVVSREAEQKSYVPSHRAELQVAYTPSGNLAIPSGDQGQTKLRNPAQVKDYTGGGAPVFGTSATPAQVGALTATRDIYEDRSGNFQSYGDILGQLDSNPYIPGQPNM
jgi:hypothetical protein